MLDKLQYLLCQKPRQEQSDHNNKCQYISSRNVNKTYSTKKKKRKKEKRKKVVEATSTGLD